MNHKKDCISGGQVISACIAIVGFLVFIFLGFNSQSGFHIDSALYTTPVTNLAKGLGWKFHGFHYQLNIYPAGLYSFHSVLYPMVLGLVLKASSYGKLSMYLAIISAITFGCYFIAYQFTNRLSERSPKLICIEAILVSIAAGLTAIYLEGRPEQLVPLIILIPYLAHFKIRSSFEKRIIALSCIHGSITSILGLLSPLTAIAYLAGMCGISINKNRYATQFPIARALLAYAASASAVIIIVFAFCDFSFFKWLSDTMTAGASNPYTRDWARILDTKSWTLRDLFLDILPSLWNLPIFASIVYIFIGLIRNSQYVIVVAFAFLISALLPTAQPYIYQGFIPLMAAVALSYSANLKLSRICKLGYLTPFLAYLSICLLLFGRQALLYLAYVKSGTPFNETKQQLSKLTSLASQQDEYIAYFWFQRPSFVVFSEASERWVTTEMPNLSTQDEELCLYQKNTGKRIAYIVIPQMWQVKHAPNMLVSCGITYGKIHDGWNPVKANFASIPLGGEMPGYQYALYKRIPNVPSSK